VQQVRRNVSLLHRNLSVCEFGSCATNSSWHNKPALSSVADALVSLPKPDLTGMNFPSQGRKTVEAVGRQKERDSEREKRGGEKGGEPVAEAFGAGLGMGLH